MNARRTALAALVLAVTAGCHRPEMARLSGSAAILAAARLRSNCTVSTLGLPVPGAGGLRPTVAANPASGLFAIAWLELGASDRLRLAAIDAHADFVQQPRDVAPGFHGLATPRLCASDGGFTLAFAGRDPQQREGIYVVAVDASGDVTPPRLVLPAAGARVLAVLDTGRSLLLAWNDWTAEHPRIRLSALLPDEDTAQSTVDLAAAPFDPSFDLVAEGTGARAAWVAADGPDNDPTDTVYTGTFDPSALPTSPAARVGTGTHPSLAPVPGASYAHHTHVPPVPGASHADHLPVPTAGDDALVLLTERPAEGLWLGALSAGRELLALPSPGTGHLGALAPVPSGPRAGVAACFARAERTTEGDGIYCEMLDGRGRVRPHTLTGVAGGALGVPDLDVASLGGTSAVVWQQADDSVGFAVGVALYSCPR